MVWIPTWVSVAPFTTETYILLAIVEPSFWQWVEPVCSLRDNKSWKGISRKIQGTMRKVGMSSDKKQGKTWISCTSALDRSFLALCSFLIGFCNKWDNFTTYGNSKHFGKKTCSLNCFRTRGTQRGAENGRITHLRHTDKFVSLTQKTNFMAMHKQRHTLPACHKTSASL